MHTYMQLVIVSCLGHRQGQRRAFLYISSAAFRTASVTRSRSQVWLMSRVAACIARLLTFWRLCSRTNELNCPFEPVCRHKGGGTATDGLPVNCRQACSEAWAVASALRCQKKRIDEQEPVVRCGVLHRPLCIIIQYLQLADAS